MIAFSERLSEWVGTGTRVFVNVYLERDYCFVSCAFLRGSFNDVVFKRCGGLTEEP